MEKFPKNINKFRDFLSRTKHKFSVEGRFSLLNYDFVEPKVRAGQENLLLERGQRKASVDMCEILDSKRMGIVLVLLRQNHKPVMVCRLLAIWSHPGQLT